MTCHHPFRSLLAPPVLGTGALPVFDTSASIISSSAMSHPSGTPPQQSAISPRGSTLWAQASANTYAQQHTTLSSQTTQPTVSPRGPALSQLHSQPAGVTLRSPVMAGSNLSGISTSAGSAPGPALMRPPPKRAPNADVDGSIVIVIATDAPIDHRTLHRLGMRVRRCVCARVHASVLACLCSHSCACTRVPCLLMCLCVCVRVSVRVCMYVGECVCVAIY